MIVDTSALVAILYKEPEHLQFAQLLHEADVLRVSVVSFVELSIVIERQASMSALTQVDALFRRAGILLEPVTVEQGHLARQAFLDFGKGRHPAGLNFGDCFPYALSKALGEPLLFKGRHFASTDVAAVVGS